MTPDEMLDELKDAGDDASSDFNDGLEGWFGWNLVGTELTITFNSGGDAPTESASWRLVPTGGQS